MIELLKVRWKPVRLVVVSVNRVGRQVLKGAGRRLFRNLFANQSAESDNGQGIRSRVKT